MLVARSCGGVLMFERYTEKARRSIFFARYALLDFHQTSDMHDVTLTAIEVRLRKEADLQK